MAANPAELFYQDEHGDLSRSGFSVPELTVDPVALTALIDAAKLVTASKIYRALIANDLAVTDSTTASPYDIQDKLVMEFRDALGFSQRFIVPAPMETTAGGPVFLEDETVDPTNAQIAALITQILAIVVTRAGTALANYIRGWRAKRQRATP